MAQQDVAIGDTGQQMVDKLDNNFDELYAGVPIVNQQLVEWAHGKDYQPIVITRDAEDIITSMTVQWPDGSGGTFTSTDWNATHECYDGYTITHTASGQTVTQAAVTRNTEGAIINKPLLTVT